MHYGKTGVREKPVGNLENKTNSVNNSFIFLTIIIGNYFRIKGTRYFVNYLINSSYSFVCLHWKKTNYFLYISI